ncbi:hypothetical protein [Halorussus sp. MSC15.2]|uniref:hypothetical protein n=1 Tax=Halorussus sp. MSC15.2 TaxID=2283638 RepID=UPI0013CFC673|nr:hypothetical protein [Halorussus sp. MSC15.2]NEU58454.1 hypothetical protein [Halorussus sp. MSC15.2]
MSDAPDGEIVEETDDFIHVRFRDPDDFDAIRTPDWAENAASDVAEGAEVRTGKLKDEDDWLVESVLIPAGTDDEEAERRAEEIVEKIES